MGLILRCRQNFTPQVRSAIALRYVVSSAADGSLPDNHVSTKRACNAHTCPSSVALPSSIKLARDSTPDKRRHSVSPSIEFNHDGVRPPHRERFPSIIPDCKAYDFSAEIPFTSFYDARRVRISPTAFLASAIASSINPPQPLRTAPTAHTPGRAVSSLSLVVTKPLASR